MNRSIIAFVTLVLLGAACTEKLTTPGECPVSCPGGQSVFRDTVLTPILQGDSSFVGYVTPSQLLSVLVSNGGSYGQTRAIFRFLPRGDSILVNDTSRAFTMDSIQLLLGLQALDTTVTNPVLQIYRLPITVDTTITVDSLDMLMTPAALLREYPLPLNTHSGNFTMSFGPGDLGLFSFSSLDSTRLQIGVRIKADGPTGARIGTPASGTSGPEIGYWVTIADVDTSLTTQQIGRAALQAFTVRPVAFPPAGVLAVGGDPVARSFIRFALPPFLRDSSTIIRATLELTTDAPLFGIPSDTAIVIATSMLADFGAKSPVVTSVLGAGVILPGTTSVSIEIATLVQLWQGKTPLPSVVRLSLGQEGGTFLAPRFLSTSSLVGMPRLRITYRPPFAFQGF